VFCPDPSDGVGEHVWPLWFIKEFHGEGPFTTARGGEPYTKRDKKPYESDSLLGVHVPACTPCNGLLNRTIEEPAKPIVKRILRNADSSDELVMTAHECAALARWVLKVGLLSAHPAADYDHPGLQRDIEVPRFSAVRREWLDWMRDETAPPEGFSVFVTRTGRHGASVDPAVKQRIVLPRLVVDGADACFMSRSFGFRGLNVTIVWHPGWPIKHAQVDAGRAVRLLPAPYEVNLGAVPIVHPQELAFWDGSIGQLAVSAERLSVLAQQPLSVESDPFMAFFAS
jgi:hypothetical protein